MKKKLLYLTAIVLFSATSINAQIKYIDAGGYTISGTGYTSLASVADINTAFYGSADFISGSQPFDGAKKTIGVAPYEFFYIGGSDAAGRIYSNVDNQTAYSTSPGTAPSIGGEFGAKFGRIQPNGAGTTARRQFGVTVPAGETATCYLMVDVANPTFTYITASDATPVTVPVSTGDALSTTVALKFTNSTAATESYTFWVATGKLSFYRVYFADVTLPYSTLSNKDFQKQSNVTVFSKDSKIFLTNVTATTNVNVYSVSGALVKTAEVSGDASIDVNSGVYIVKATSTEGEKAVKVIVQ